MKPLLASALAISISLAPLTTHAASHSCEDLFEVSKISESTGLTSVDVEVAHETVGALSKIKVLNERYGKRTRGYIIISVAMVTSAAVSSHLTAELPKDMAFLTQLVGQVATLGIYVFGSPIWEPMSSAFRKFAFGLNKEESAPSTDTALERLWPKTQQHYSLNAQMSRNVIQSFLLAAHANFTTARIAMNENQRELAVDQMAEIAVRLRRLFAEIDPRDPSITLAVRSSFSRHISPEANLQSEILARIEQVDRGFTDREVELYYRELLTAWLTTSQNP